LLSRIWTTGDFDGVTGRFLGDAAPAAAVARAAFEVVAVVGAGFTGADFTGAVFAGAVFAGAVFAVFADVAFADFDVADFDFAGFDFAGFDFAGFDFAGLLRFDIGSDAIIVREPASVVRRADCVGCVSDSPVRRPDYFFASNMPASYSTISPATADAATVSGDARYSLPGPDRPL